jgi:tetratricopeptide (TPR) repeat protein
LKIFLIIIGFSAGVCLADENSDFAKKGEEAFKQKDFDQAINCYTKVIEIDPADVKAYYVLGWAYQQKGQIDSAIENYNEAIKLCTNNISLSNTLFSRGGAYLQETNLDKAINDFSKVISLTPDFVDAYIVRAYARSLRSDDDGVIADCNSAIKINPELTMAYLYRSIAFVNKHDLNKVIADCSKIIQLDPNIVQAYVNRGASYAEKKDFDLAIKDFNKAIQLKPQSASLLASRGMVSFQQGDYNSGIQDLKSAIQIDTNCAVAYNNFAWLLSVTSDENLRNGNKALEYAKRACELDGYRDFRYLGTLAAAYAETGNFEEAVKWQKKSMELGLSKNDIKEAQDHLDLYKQNKPYHAEP